MAANNSKEFGLPNGERAFAVVNANPTTGLPRLSRTAFDIMMGFVPGASGVVLNAFRAAIANATETVLEEIDRSLVASASGVPMTIRSTSAADIGPTVRVIALGANYLPVAAVDVVLAGTAPVSILAGLPLTRINSLVRISGDFAGNVLVENGGVTYGFVKAGQQTQRSSRYTIPAGFRFFLTESMSALAKDTGAAVGCIVSLQLKPAASTGFGTLFSLDLRSDGSSTAFFPLSVPQGLTGPMDLRATATATATGVDVQSVIAGVLQDLSVVG